MSTKRVPSITLASILGLAATAPLSFAATVAPHANPASPTTPAITEPVLPYPVVTLAPAPPAAPVAAEPAAPPGEAPATQPSPETTSSAAPPPASPADTQISTASTAAPAPGHVSVLGFDEALGAPEAPYGELIYELAGRYGVNPHVVAAVVRVESSFNPKAVSPKGACGLMQLLPATARRFGVTRKDLFDPAKNLEAGIRYLQWLMVRFGGDLQRVLAAYNAGEGAVDRFGGVPPYRETRAYLGRILTLLGLATAPAAGAGH